MKDLISVIIAIYNGEKYITKCIESIINQTYKNIEIVVIDDGSKDNSLNLLKKISKKDNRIKIIHIENSGVSAARNIGINNASGKYIAFIDADDFVEEKYIEDLYSNMQESGLVIGNYYSYYEDKEKFVSFNINKQKLNNIIAIKNIFLPIEVGRYNPVVVWNKMYDLKIIREKNIKFKEKLNKFEDGLFNYEYLHYCKKIQIINSKNYIYRILSSSTIHKYNDLYDEDEYIYKELLKTIKQYKEQELLREELKICKITLMLSVYKNNLLHKSNSLPIKQKVYIINKKYKENRKYLDKIDKSRLTSNQRIMLFLLKYKLGFILLLK